MRFGVLGMLLLLAAPASVAYELGEGDAYIAAPHSITLSAGTTQEVDLRVQALAVCEETAARPDPIVVELVEGGTGPDDGQGPAWEFLANNWTLDWEANGGGNYSLDTTIILEVTAYGSNPAGVAGEVRFEIAAASDPDVCSVDGFRLPARSGHGHISVGARPAASEDAPGLPLGLLLAGLAAVVGRRR